MENTTLKEYAQPLLSEDSLLREMRDESLAQGLPAISAPPELGRLLQVLIVSGGFKRVLEIGTLFGYTTTLMAQVLPPDGRIITLEADEHHAGIARNNFRRAGVADRVTIREGQALDSLAGLSGETFDLAFIDADKPSYPAYFDWALKLSRPGSVIVADNMWRRGQVVNPPENDEGNQALKHLMHEIAGNKRLITTIVSRLDGSDAATVSVVR